MINKLIFYSQNTEEWFLRVSIIYYGAMFMFIYAPLRQYILNCIFSEQYITNSIIDIYPLIGFKGTLINWAVSVFKENNIK